ncbi:polynucleotide 5'-hydroxyl-kinase NOL9-like isoform X2 [Phalaenopsis equestris]|uniref:polynucleotide 5'-hydroxyl-kinase NOL9-like isoform X2 n=1 Tax=Phalaenopsis equestris TaxID=78828 RepID=UPI0009E4DDF0|nr:polynucleotide 5'-hydroxyl-kinase NOL9-like isoform X2 [Phalaenopsis equestris]
MRENRDAPSPLPRTLISPSWQEAADNIAYDSATFPPPITVICGPAHSGKATFSRLLLNTLLERYKRVAYLDSNVGQPEFTVTGCVALHIIDKQTPDLTILYLKNPDRCVFFGHVSAKKESNSYFSSIIFLYDYFRRGFYQVDETDNPCKILLPLIINTYGWVKGTGYDVLVAMLRHTSPTHVAKVCSSSESKNLPNGLFWLENPQRKPVNLVHICYGNETSYLPKIMKKEACMLRDIRIIAYFRQCLPREMNFLNHKEFCDQLASVPLKEIPLSRVQVKHNCCQVVSSVVSQGLNASIVGLAVRSSAIAENNTPWCIGLGIVRAVDSSKDQLYLLTPVAPSTLKKVELIIQSTIDIPICLQQIFV